jgi:hypothetical protein
VVVRLLLVLDLEAVDVECLGMFHVPGVGDPLKEEEGKDVRLEVSWIDRTPETVRGIPEAAFEFLLS